MRKLIPLAAIVLCALIGGTLGMFLRGADPSGGSAEARAAQPSEFFKFPNQFVVPILEGGKVGAVVVLSLSLELDEGSSETYQRQEPKLRDEVLRILFEHANSGGFRGTFTEQSNLTTLRRALWEGGRKIVGPSLRDVLITDIVRQDGG